MKLVTTHQLDEQVLTGLFDRRHVAVRVPNFYGSEEAGKLAEQLYKDIDAAVAAGIYESNIDSFWSVANDVSRRDRYLGAARPLQTRMRELSAPHASPVDMLRIALDDAWPAGASLLRLDGRMTPFGATRLWRTDSEALPHQDILRREKSNDTAEVRLISQLGVNIYLDVAEAGGHLQMWSKIVCDDEYLQLGDSYRGSYGYPRELLGEAALEIVPEVGDLVLINTEYVHAISRVTAGRRITVSGFVGQTGRDQPLCCWS